MATTARELMTAEQYFERVPTRHYSQLIDGEVVMDEPTVGHQVVVMRILFALNDWTRAVPRRGEVFIPINVLMDEHNVFGPDISYRSYERLGLPELWLVDSPVATVLVYRRSRPTVADFDVALELTRGESLTSPLLPGFSLALEAIFAPLRPAS